MKTIKNFNIKIFSDGADKSSMLEMYAKPFIQGLTTNPTLMKKAGVVDYRKFCKDILKVINDKPISFEVFSDEFPEMERQAMEISSWGDNVYVKIPVTNTKGQSSYDLIKRLTNKGIKVNVTAVMTIDQVNHIIPSLSAKVPSYISVFAGRIADTGRDPIPIMNAVIEKISHVPSAELIWASPRELLNIIQANDIGCHIITVTNEFINKLDLIDYDLNKFSLDTVKMFYDDALKAGYRI